MPGVHRPIEYSFATPADLGNLSTYQRFADKVGLDRQRKTGYGFLHCVDYAGDRVTRITEDVDYLRALVEGVDAEVLADLEVPDGVFTMSRDGWPDEW